MKLLGSNNSVKKHVLAILERFLNGPLCSSFWTRSFFFGMITTTSSDLYSQWQLRVSTSQRRWGMSSNPQADCHQRLQVEKTEGFNRTKRVNLALLFKYAQEWLVWPAVIVMICQVGFRLHVTSPKPTICCIFGCFDWPNLCMPAV